MPTLNIEAQVSDLRYSVSIKNSLAPNVAGGSDIIGGLAVHASTTTRWQ